MGYFKIKGPVRLSGEVKVSGAKNSSLPILVASIIVDGESLIENVPDLLDVSTMIEILRSVGHEVEFSNGRVRVKPPSSANTDVPYELVRRMRASFNVLGPLAAKYGRAKVALPGGCSIGVRPVDFHIEGLRKMGFDISIEHGFVTAVRKDPKSTRITLPKPSVGATEHLMTTAAVIDGLEITIENAAMEPEIVDLQDFLRKIGVEVEGAGTGIVHVKGGVKPGDVKHRVIPDRIEAGTYVIAIAATGGEGKIVGLIPDHLNALWEALEKAGVELKIGEREVHVFGVDRPNPLSIDVSPYPGFPTDLQPQMMAFLSVARGTSHIRENVFHSRFLHVDELKRMGARIEISDSTAIIDGVEKLSGAPVKGTDLRATVALVIAAFMAEGESEIHHVEHIFRGYENVLEKFSSLGGEIEYVEVLEYED